MILSVHNQNPGTPLDPQRANAARFQIGAVWVDVTDAPGQAQAEAQYADYVRLAHEAQKKELLRIARENREIALNRLNGHYLDADIAGDEAAKAAILACKASLKGMFADPRIVNAVDGDVKAAAATIWTEIYTALYIASPATFVAFKGLDTL